MMCHGWQENIKINLDRWRECGYTLVECLDVSFHLLCRSLMCSGDEVNEA
jgi:hypothetical protein